jgi:predicted nucleotide-binding protein
MVTQQLDQTPLEYARLVISREEAKALLQQQLDKGIALRNVKIRTVQELEKARELRMDWSQFTTAMLNQMFDSEAVAEEYNNWVGKILPEFAKLEQFIEQFYDEMDQRLNRLHSIMEHVNNRPDVVPGGRQQQLGHQHQSSSGYASPPAHNAHPSHASHSSNRVSSAASSMHSSRMTQHEPAPEPARPRMEEKKPMVAPSQQPSEHHSSIPRASQQPAAVPKRPGGARSGLLVVHQRDEMIEKAVTTFGTKLGLEMTIVYEPEGSKALLDKLAHQPGVTFVTILASNDYIGSARRGNDEQFAVTSSRAIFELGFCVGRLGAEKVMVLHTSGMGLFEDEFGILYIQIDQSDGWQLQLARHWKRAGVEVDLNKLC